MRGFSIYEQNTRTSAKSFVGKSYAKGNYGLNNFMGVVSDQITYESSNEDVFTVETNKDGTGKLTAVGAGTATLTVIAYEFGDVNKELVVFNVYTIIVADEKIVVTQKDTKTFELAFGEALEETPAPEALVITKVDPSKRNIAVNETKL